MRLGALTFAVLFAAGGLVTSVADAQSGADLVSACIANGGSTSMCYGLRGTLRTLGGVCRDGTLNQRGCTLIDGVTVDEALVAAHEASWLARTLELQRGLDDRHPLQDELWAHTHNSFNADAYGFQALGGLDRNHIYTVTDQLRMGARAIELDIHWAESTSGDPAAGFKGVVVCHAEAVNFSITTMHFGCGINDPTLVDHLTEIKAWMDAHPSEFLMIYLENALDNNVTAHNAAASQIDQIFGDLVYKPASNCGALPMDTSRRQLFESGARVIFTGNCGPGAWGGYVHDRGPRWREGGLDHGTDFPAYPCTEERAAENFAFNWIRHWADETGLSNGTGGGGDVTIDDAINMVACGVNMVGLDNLVPFDRRMEPLAWSWGYYEPSTSRDGFCAVHGFHGRFRAGDCTVHKVVVTVPRKGRKPAKKTVEEFRAWPFACYDGSNWHVTAKADRFSQGQATCQAEGLGAFSVPWNGYENERLKDVRGDLSGIWLNYRASGGTWVS